MACRWPGPPDRRLPSLATDTLGGFASIRLEDRDLLRRKLLVTNSYYPQQSCMDARAHTLCQSTAAEPLSFVSILTLPCCLVKIFFSSRLCNFPHDAGRQVCCNARCAPAHSRSAVCPASCWRQCEERVPQSYPKRQQSAMPRIPKRPLQYGILTWA